MLKLLRALERREVIGSKTYLTVFAPPSDVDKMALFLNSCASDSVATMY